MSRFNAYVVEGGSFQELEELTQRLVGSDKGIMDDVIKRKAVILLERGVEETAALDISLASHVGYMVRAISVTKPVALLARLEVTLDRLERSSVAKRYPELIFTVTGARTSLSDARAKLLGMRQERAYLETRLSEVRDELLKASREGKSIAGRLRCLLEHHTRIA
jgi:hypothetical protein